MIDESKESNINELRQLFWYKWFNFSANAEELIKI